MITYRQTEIQMLKENKECEAEYIGKTGDHQLSCRLVNSSFLSNWFPNGESL